MIYQDLALCNDLDVASNIFLGRELRTPLVGRIRVLDRRAMAAEAARLLAELGLTIPPDRLVGSLSGGERQLVAVARALQFQPRLLLMDEPTAALSAEKIRVLLTLVAQLKERGVAILLVSHRFTDILHVCDRIVVMRQGTVVGEVAPHAQTPEHTMARMHELMTGEDFAGGMTSAADATCAPGAPRRRWLRTGVGGVNPGLLIALVGLFVGLSDLVAVLLRLDQPAQHRQGERHRRTSRLSARPSSSSAAASTCPSAR